MTLSSAVAEDRQIGEQARTIGSDSNVHGRFWSRLALVLLLAAIVVSLGTRLVARDAVITADEDNWMRRAGGFAYGLVNGQFGRTYQNGHPGVTTMWIATLTLGPDRMIQYADRVHNQRFVGRVAGFWEALVDARLGFALATASLVALIACLTWRLFGPGVGVLAALVVGLEPFYLGISQLVHMDALLSGCMVASVLAALIRWTAGGGRWWVAMSGMLAGLAILSKSPGVFLLIFVCALAVARAYVWWRPDCGRRPLSGWHPASGCHPLSKCHPERSEGPSGSTGRARGSFASLRMTLGKWMTRAKRMSLGKRMTSGVMMTPEHRMTPGLRTTPEERVPPGDRMTPGVIARDLALFFGMAGLTVVLLWPAIWVLGPAEILGRVVAFTRETGGQPHEAGTYFLGSQRTDPGPLFYPVALAFRLAPVTVVGLVLLIAFVRRIERPRRAAVIGLALYSLGFLAMMTLGAKKFDRYVLPTLPALGVLAAVGLWLGLQSLRSFPWRIAATAIVIGLTIWPVATSYPYFLSYYSPLLGGGAAAQRQVMVGNGEGLDEVARWLNSRPDAENLWVVSHSYDILQPLIVASGEPLRDRVPSNADYVVLYRFQIQIGQSPRVLAEYLERHQPELTVWINGIDYARVYRGPHLPAETGDGAT